MLPSSTQALPVRLCLSGPEAGAVDRWVASLGWQSVGTDPATPVVPLLTLADVPALLGEGTSDAGEDVVLLVGDDEPVSAARAASHPQVREVIGWPDERDTLPATADRLLARRGRTTVDDLRVAGGSGGVGTTTVAIALAGLSAWKRRPTLVLRRPVGAGGIDKVGAPIGELDGTTAWRGANPVPGVRELRTLEVEDPTVPVGEGPASLVVRDLGVATEADVLVIRRDRAGLAATTRTTAGVIVVTDIGPAPVAAVQRAAAGRRVVTVEWSARVARAGLRGRVPAGLPGAWLRRLEPVIGRGGWR